jgi:hypothetical protein
MFPNTFNGISNPCRVTSGLSDESTTNTLQCASSGDIMIIKHFAAFSPQYIEVKVQASNPSFSGSTAHWKIYTYQDQTQSSSVLIDKNEQAGTVNISTIGKPIKSEVNFYQPRSGCIFSEKCTIDFYLFPHLRKTLNPSTT